VCVCVCVCVCVRACVYVGVGWCLASINLIPNNFPIPHRGKRAW